MRKSSVVPLSTMLLLSAVLPTSAAMQTICEYVFGRGEDCAGLCNEIPKQSWRRAWNDSSAASIDPTQPRPPRPLKITSCSGQTIGIGMCRWTICGPVPTADPRQPLHPAKLPKVDSPVPGPHIGPTQPGLLEGDGGFARQGPAGTGTPSAPTGGGRSLGGSTYSR
jgi:hypothetical protein